MGRIARANRHKRSGGSGGASGAIVSLLVLAALGAFLWIGFKHFTGKKSQTAGPATPADTMRNWKRIHSLDIGDIPKQIADSWLFQFKLNPMSRVGGQLIPSVWVDIQYEKGRFSCLQMSGYSLANERAMPVNLLTEDKFAGLREGKLLASFIVSLGQMGDGKSMERETDNFHFFGWQHLKRKGLKSSLICVARKNFSRAHDMMIRAKSDWAAGTACGTQPAATSQSRFAVRIDKISGDRDRVLIEVCKVSGLDAVAGGMILDNLPRRVKTNVLRYEAEQIKKQLEAAGAKVTIE
jgi:ribosomal protein L7/L12